MDFLRKGRQLPASNAGIGACSYFFHGADGASQGFVVPPRTASLLLLFE